MLTSQIHSMCGNFWIVVIASQMAQGNPKPQISTAVTRALCPLFATKAIPEIVLGHLCERHLRDPGQEPYLNCVHHIVSCPHDIPGWKRCVNSQGASSCKKRPAKGALWLPLISMPRAAHFNHNILDLTDVS